jgi:predicted metal-binding protein
VDFCREGLVYTLIPEAMGLDVVKTMAEVDIKIEFPPKEWVKKIAIIGTRR